MEEQVDHVPEIMKLTAELNRDSITHAEPKAGMFLLFLVSGLTMIGTLSGMVVSMSYLNRPPGDHWVTSVLLFSLLGGIAGCGIGMLALGFKGLVQWETREHQKERERDQSKARLS